MYEYVCVCELFTITMASPMWQENIRTGYFCVENLLSYKIFSTLGSGEPYILKKFLIKVLVKVISIMDESSCF